MSPIPLSRTFAAAAPPAALIFDTPTAAWRAGGSSTSRELDSLADVISFGVAPATLAFAAGMRGGWDWIGLVYFVCCGVSRLARYSVTAESLSAGGDKVKYFEGTPIPTSVLLTAVLALAVGRVASAMRGVVQLGPWTLHPLVLLFVLSGSLMSKTLNSQAVATTRRTRGWPVTVTWPGASQRIGRIRISCRITIRISGVRSSAPPTGGTTRRSGRRNGNVIAFSSPAAGRPGLPTRALPAR